MTQEQKPFETQTYNELLRVCNANMTQEHLVIKNYIERINAEIRRLQEENQQLRNLTQQLADAPTWGKWQDATVHNLVEVSIGIYEFETNDGVTFLASKRHDDVSSSSWVLMDGQLRNACDFELNPRFRRLNYEPKPAQEVEKIYFIDNHGSEYTVEDLAGDPGQDDTTRELARDLLAKVAECKEKDARIRELEGK